MVATSPNLCKEEEGFFDGEDDDEETSKILARNLHFDWAGAHHKDTRIYNNFNKRTKGSVMDFLPSFSDFEKAEKELFKQLYPQSCACQTKVSELKRVKI